MDEWLEKDDRERQSVFNRRLIVAGIAQAAGLGLVAARLFQLQVTEQPRYSRLADLNRTATQLIAARRGRIYDRFGQVLVTGEEAFRAVFVPSLASDPEAVLDLFQRIVPIETGEKRRLLARARRQRPNEPIILAEDLDFEQVAQLALLAPRLPGVETEHAARRRYPEGHLAGHVVGYVGHVEDVAIDDDPILRLPWMRAGKAGLERGMDQHLRGKSGSVRLEVDAKGHITRVIGRHEPVNGRDVVTTLDVRLQERVLKRIESERRAAVVVMDVALGEVIVMASVPTYDPGRIVAGLSQDEWQRLRSSPDDPLINRTISGQYPPGSTFKMVTALAALEAGVVQEREQIRCTGRHTYADHTYRCWNRGGHGDMDMVAALRESCDVYFYTLAQRTGIDRIAAMAHRLGLGDTFDCGLELQKPGVVPGRDWKIGRFGRRWLGGETILAGIGQGYVLSTPLQLAVMTARIASGRAVAPALVRAPSSASDFPALDISSAHLDFVRRGMLACVNGDGGTGWRARLDRNGVAVAGKTGTSQVSRASVLRPNDELAWVQRDHALFVAYVPADAPRYAIAVVIEHGGSGGTAAAPLARDVLEMVLEHDPMARPAFSVAAPAAAAPGKAGRAG